MTQQLFNNLFLILFLLFSSFLFILINNSLFFINSSSSSLEENNFNLNNKSIFIENNKRIFASKSEEFNKLKILKQNKKRHAIIKTNFGVRHYYVRRNKNLNIYGINKKQKLLKLSILTTKNTEKCPNKLDAVTEGYNKRLYLFSGEIVYEVWRDIYGLQQRQSYLIYELFPNGPRQVTAALINHKSGITLLIAWNRVYRYKWNKKNKRFYMARNSPQELPYKINFIPLIGFQWNKGRLILANKDRFAIYDPYRNLAPFIAKVSDYFPNLATEKLIGVIKYNQESILWMTKRGYIQLYDLNKYKIGLEMPIDLTRFIACLN